MKFIIFDLDGVVLEKSSFSRQLESRFGISPEMTSPFFKGPFADCQTGNGDLKQEIEPFLRQWGWHSTVQSFLDFWFACDQNVQTSVLDDIANLRKLGYQCYLATNQEQYRAQFLNAKIRISEYFDATFSSHMLGHRKPSSNFFKIIQKSIHASPETIWFWDDTPSNVQSANDLGWKACLFETAQDFHSKLHSITNPSP